MPFTAGGADAEFNVDVNLDVDEAQAAAEFAKLSKAIAAALKSPEVQKSVASIVTSFQKVFTGTTKSSAQTWKTVQTQGQQAAHNIGKAFDDVARKSKAAFNANQARGSSNELQALNALVAGLAGNFEHLATDVRTTNTVLKEMSAGARAQLAAVTQEQRTLQQQLTSQNATLNTQAQERANKLTNETKLALANIRSQSAADRNASNERIANIRRFTQIATTTIRGLTQVFRTVFAAGTAAVRGFVNTAGSIVRGLASTFRSVFSTISNIVRSFTSAFARAFSTIGRGVGSALAGVSRAIRSALSRDESAVKESMSRRERAMASSAGRQQSILSRGAGAVGLLGGGAAIGSLLTSGFQRSGEVELLNLTFNALLGNADKAKSVLADLSEYARTTPFDFTEIAGSVAQLTAALGDVDKATNLTKFLGDIVALTGGTTESLGRVRLALSQIAGAGRLDSANLRQITESLPGVPIAQILADKFFGGSVEAYSKARDAGELGAHVSAEAFFTAFMEGANEKFPELKGFAEVAGTTLTGLTQNLKENFAIFGATLIDLVKGPIKNAIAGINTVLDLGGQFVSGKLFATSAGTTPYGASIVTPLTDNLEKLKLVRDILGKVAVALGALLAFKGVFAVLGYGIRLALTPLGLLVLAVSGVVAAWSLFMRASEQFAETWKVVTYQFRPAIDAVVRLGRAFKGAFSGSGGGDGKPSILTRIGDAMKYVNVVLARLIAGFRVFANYLSAGLEFRGFTDFANTLDTAVTAGLAVLFHGTEWKAALDDARAEGGSQVLNLLEDTFLGPMVRFFRGPFLNVAKTIIGFISNIVSQIASAVGDIWGLVFGKGQDNPTDTMVQQLFGGEGDKRSTGTKILDRLEETFLGPVVGFFRGPFADAIEAAGNFIGGLFQTYLIPGFKTVFNFFAHDFIPGIVNVAQSIGNFLSPAIHTAGDLIGQVGTLLAPIGGAIEGFVSTWKGKGVGAAFSSLWDGVVEAAGNLWEGTDGNGGIKAGLQSAIDSITNWFSTTFTGKNVETWITAALNGIRKVGEAIGKVIGSPEFLGTVVVSAAAVAAAIAAVLGAFSLGLVQGLAKESVRWGKLIAGALQDGWNNLAEGALSFLPQPVVDAVNAMLGNPVIGTAIGVGALALGGIVMKAVVGGLVSAAETSAKSTSVGQGLKGETSLGGIGLTLAGGLFRAIGNGFKGLKIGASGLVGMIFGGKNVAGDGSAETTAGGGIAARLVGGMSRFFRTVNPLSGLSAKLKEGDTTVQKNFGSVGVGIATAIIGGIASFEFGQYEGKKGGAGSLVLALLGGAATGASIGFAFAEGPGAAVGAVIGAAVSGVGFAIGESGRKAEIAAAQVQLYSDALNGVKPGADAATAAAQAFVDQLTAPGSSDTIRNVFLTAGTDITSFLAEGVSDPSSKVDLDNALLGLVQDFGLKISGTHLSANARNFVADVRDAIRDAASKGEQFNFNDFLTGYQNKHGSGGIDAMRELKDAGFDLGGALDYASSNANSLDQALKLQGANTTLTNLATGATTASDAMLTVDDALKEIHDGLNSGDTASQLADILSNKDLSSTNALQALSDAAGEVADKLDKAKQAFKEALDAVKVGVNDPGAKTFQGLTDKIVADLPNIASGFQQIYTDFKNGDITPNVKFARLDLATADFKSTLTDTIQQAVDAGLITDDASMDTFLNNLKTQINSSGLDVDTQNMLNGVVDAFINGDYTSLLTPITSALTDQQTLAETGRIMAQRLTASITGSAKGIVGGFADAAASIQVSQGTPAIPTPFDANAGTDEGTTTGSNYMSAIPTGAHAGRSRAITALKPEITALATDLKPTATTSGTDIGNVFVKSIGQGIIAATGNASSAAGGVVKSAVKSASGGGGAMYSVGANLMTSFGRGIRDAGVGAVIAAVQVANAVTNATKSALKIKSPSKVFIDIGTQIGAGFVKGIEDSATSMTDALEKALTDAVKNGTDKAYAALNKANVAGKLFDLLQPSTLPGGTSALDVTGATTSATAKLGSFTSGLRSGLSEALGGVANDSLRDAHNAISGLALDVSSSFTDLRSQYTDAKTAAKGITDYNAALAKLRTELANGTLGTAAANRERADAYKALIDDQNALNDKIARLRVQLNNGTIAGKNAAEKLANFNAKVKDLKDSFAVTSVEQYHEQLDKINRAYKAGTLAQDEYQKRLDDLGSRPGALTFDQRNILASGISTLNLGTIAGQANNATLSDALSKIREFGQAALEAGSPLGTVITQMESYRDKLVAQAKTMGLSVAQVNSLVSAFGLTNAQLAALKASVLSLNTGTVQGAENVAKINEQLSGLRDYAQTLLSAGTDPAAVITKIKALRNALVDQAKAFGFNANGIAALVKAAGLSDTALADFIKQLNDYTKAVQGATGATPGAAAGDSVARPTAEQHFHYTLPYGDPEAVALATANRLAYGGPTSW